MIIIKLILLILGAAVLAMSLSYKRLPKGILEWVIWIADIFIIIGWFIRR